MVFSRVAPAHVPYADLRGLARLRQPGSQLVRCAVASAGLVWLVRTLLVLWVRSRCAWCAVSVLVCIGAHPVAHLIGESGDSLPRPRQLAQLVGGQLQGLKVGAQRDDVHGVGLHSHGMLLLVEEEQLLGHRGLLVRGDIVRVTARGGRCAAAP